MPSVTKITPQKRHPNRRNICLDGAFAFGCNLNVVARFRLREGLVLTAAEVGQIQLGEIRQECFDSATRYLEARLHGRIELKRKLSRKQQWPEPVIEGVLDDLQRMEYLDDTKFAVARATAAASRKRHGPRRVLADLARAGVKSDVAGKVVTELYTTTDPAVIATELAERQIPRLKKLDPAVARRRLTGTLLRRGFDFDTVQTVVDRTIKSM